MVVCHCRVKHTGNYPSMEHQAGENIEGGQYCFDEPGIAQKQPELKSAGYFIANVTLPFFAGTCFSIGRAALVGAG